MELAQLPTRAGLADTSVSRHGDDLDHQFLFHHDIAGDLTGSASGICLRALRALESYSEDAFSAADVSQPFASGQLRSIARRLDGLRLRFEVWMADAGLEKRTYADGDLESADNYLGEVANSKVRNIARACNQVGSSLRAIHVDFENMLEDTGQDKVDSVKKERDRLNSACDNIEVATRSLNGLINQIQMSRALDSGMGPYSQIRERVESALQHADYTDQDTSSLNTNHEYGGPMSDSSGDSVLSIRRQSQDAADVHSSNHEQMLGRDLDLQEHNQEQQLHTGPWQPDRPAPRIGISTSPQGDIVIPVGQSPGGSPFRSDRKLWWSRSRKGDYEPVRSDVDNAEDISEGFSGLASFMEGSKHTAMVRRYSYLQLRVILDQQDTLRELEQELLYRDRTHAARWNSPAPSNAGKSERSKGSRELLREINKELSEYDANLLRARQMLHRKQPAKVDYRILSDHLANTQPLATSEAEPFKHRDDLVAIFPDEGTSLYLLIGELFSYNFPLVRLYLKLLVAIALRIQTVALLIVPTLMIFYRNEGEVKTLPVIVLCTFLWYLTLLMLSGFHDSRIFAATASYYAFHLLLLSINKGQE